jgi:hypothetical protein
MGGILNEILEALAQKQRQMCEMMDILIDFTIETFYCVYVSHTNMFSTINLQNIIYS